MVGKKGLLQPWLDALSMGEARTDALGGLCDRGVRVQLRSSVGEFIS